MEILKAHAIIRDAVKESDDSIRHMMVHDAINMLRAGGHVPSKGSLI